MNTHSLQAVVFSLLTTMAVDAMAATDLYVPRARTDLFRGTNLPSGFLTSNGTNSYVLNHQVGSQFLDTLPQWNMAYLPTRASAIGNLSYQMISNNVGISEAGYGLQCVSFIKAMSDTGSVSTTSWRRGIAVTSITYPQGIEDKVIATFSSATQYSGHTGVVLSANFVNGKVSQVWVADENWGGNGKIYKHLLSSSGTGVNNLSNYYIVQK